MELIIELIKNSGLNARQIAIRTGVSHVAIGNILSGKTKDIALSNAFKLSDTLGVDINEFREKKNEI